jgi:uncharacterized membrane protein
VTTGAQFAKLRADLIAMVPPRLPARDDLVTATGVLELAGAAGLLYPPVAPLAAAGLKVLLVLMFPPTIRAARARPSIGGRAATPIEWRTLLRASRV